jgi:hypothetical protein
MSFLKRFDEALDKAFQPKVDNFKVLEQKLINEIILSEAKVDEKGVALAEGIKIVLKKATDDLINVQAQVKELSTNLEKLDDLKTRIEKIELYTGFTRKVDPTAQAKVKSAFEM